MALSINTIWEVRLGVGAASNGGGFVFGATGTDRSQQNAAFVNINNSTITATSATNTITFTGGYTPTSADVGNIYKDSGANGATAGYYQIISTTSNTWVLDANIGTSTGLVGKMGGALDSLPTLANAMVGSNQAWVTGSAVQNSTATFTQSGLDSIGNSPPTQIFGYGTIRGDGKKATITLSGSSLTGLKFTGSFAPLVENIIIDCNGQTTSIGVDYSGGSSALGAKIRNCIIKNFTSYGINMGSLSVPVLQCEVMGGTSAATFAVVAISILYSRIHDNACPAINLTTSYAACGVCCWNEITNNSGTTSNGIYVIAGDIIVTNNIIHNNGQDGILIDSVYNVLLMVKNNIITKNGRYGVNINQGAIRATFDWDGNTYGSGSYGNVSANRHNMDDITVDVDAAYPYKNKYDIILANGVSPYVNDAVGNYQLNNLAGGGNLCRGKSFPIIGNSIGYLDMGCYQHSDPPKYRGRRGNY